MAGSQRRAIWIPAAAAYYMLVASGILVTMLRERPAFDSQKTGKVGQWRRWLLRTANIPPGGR
jgi:hypothetical protein